MMQGLEDNRQSGVDILLAMEVANSSPNMSSPGTSTSDTFDETDYELGSGNKNKRRKKIKKNKKNKPKKAMTPFMVFSKETRKLLVKENPGMTFSEIGKELGARWRGLGEQEKEIFVVKAKEDYQRFLNETEQLEALNPSRKRKTVEQKKQTKVKKSISAYLYFCNAHREQVKAMHPEMKMVEIQRLLAEKWMNSPQCVKVPFEKQAEADRDKYNADLQTGDAQVILTNERFLMGDKFSGKLKTEDAASLYELAALGTQDENVDLSFLNFSSKDSAFDSISKLASNYMKTSESVENFSRILGVDASFLSSDYGMPSGLDDL